MVAGEFIPRLIVPANGTRRAATAEVCRTFGDPLAHGVFPGWEVQPSLRDGGVSGGFFTGLERPAYHRMPLRGARPNGIVHE